MIDWNDVQKRADDEQNFADEIADGGANGIEQFYPELSPSAGVPSFTNTLGSYLIPDILTSQRVVVDLYDWSSPEALIKVYGVDLDFLCRLRDANLITICANLPAERYRNHRWLFPLLADPRTIFRSIRTPAFLKAIDPDFIERKSKRQIDLQRYFSSLGFAEIARLCSAVKAAYPPTDAASLASVLAQWLERLASFDPEAAAEVGDGFEQQVIDRVPDLMRLQHLIVSPHTAALGGNLKIERRRWVELFGEESVDATILEGHVRLQTLSAYFSEVKIGLDENDLTNEQMWSIMRSAEKINIIEYLGDAENKEDLLLAEERLRMGLIAGGDRDPDRKSIRGYVEKLEDEVTRLQQLTAGIGVAVPIAFGCVLGETPIEKAILSGFAFAGGCFTNKYLLGDHIRRVTERVVRKVRVVRVLGKRDE